MEKIYELQEENKHLQVEIYKINREKERLNLHYESVKERLDEREKAHQKEIEELKAKYEAEKEELNKIIAQQKRMINLQTRKREITDEEVQRIKELRASGLSYSKIEKETEWSKFTISRVIHGAYDN